MKKKFIKKRSKEAKDLASKKYHQRIIPNKKKIVKQKINKNTDDLY